MSKYFIQAVFCLSIVCALFVHQPVHAASPAKEVKKSTGKKTAEKQTLDKEIKELSTKDIFNKYKKTIQPVELGPSKDTDHIVIDHQIRSKGIPGEFAAKNLGFDAKDASPKDSFNELVRKAYTASQLGLLEASLHYYTEAFTRDEQNTNTLFALATLYHKLKQYSDAKKYYQKLLKIAPDYKSATSNYLAMIAQSEPQTALNEYLAIEQENPNHPGVLAQIGMIYLNMQNFDQAENYLKRSIILAPSVLQYRYNLAVVYDQAKNYRTAIELYKDLLDSRTFYKLGISENSIQNRIKFLKKTLFQQENVQPK